MKKKLSIVLMLCVTILLFSGCGSKNEQEKQQPKEQETTQKTGVKIKQLEGSLTDRDSNYSIIYKGNYYLFSTNNSEDYVIFLDELDKSIYEIVDIQIEHFSDGDFFVTYKKK